MVKLKEVTDPRLRCAAGACPGVYQTDQGAIVIVGAKPSDNVLTALQGRVSEGEQAIEIDLKFIQNLDGLVSR